MFSIHYRHLVCRVWHVACTRGGTCAGTSVVLIFSRTLSMTVSPHSPEKTAENPIPLRDAYSSRAFEIFTHNTSTQCIGRTALVVVPPSSLAKMFPESPRQSQTLEHERASLRNITMRHSCICACRCVLHTFGDRHLLRCLQVCKWLC